MHAHHPSIMLGLLFLLIALLRTECTSIYLATLVTNSELRFGSGDDLMTTRRSHIRLPSCVGNFLLTAVQQVPVSSHQIYDQSGG
ncbi:hypothetical protein M404DRAFT_1007347 [Pisolithus tinctorius Marx 270]|uniref:Secreted protein n=1 Tax=Pisolithus tinctorius Marx 270 TaxID=870435 RepID=A0A0C3NIP0_PISTI|nr:hypothetical protein M404DRAFT_1007347 [Pisolithus tinctorius Marx 270]